MADRYHEIMSEYERLKRKNRRRLVGAVAMVTVVGGLLAWVSGKSGDDSRHPDKVTISTSMAQNSEMENTASDSNRNLEEEQNNNEGEGQTLTVADAEVENALMPSENIEDKVENKEETAVYNLREGQETVNVVDESGNVGTIARTSNVHPRQTPAVNVSRLSDRLDSQYADASQVTPVERVAFLLSNGQTYQQSQLEKGKVSTLAQDEESSTNEVVKSVAVQNTQQARRQEQVLKAQETREAQKLEVAEKRRQEQRELAARKAQEKRQAEQRAQAEQRKKEQRIAEQRKQESERVAAQKRRQEEAALAEKKKRQAEQRAQAEQRKKEQQRIAEQKKREAERIAAQKRRQEEAAALAEKKKREAEAARKAAIAKAEAEKRRIEMSKASVQAGAYKTPTRAKQVQQELASLGYSSYVSEITVEGGKVYSVRTGTFPNQKEARIAVSRIQGKGLDGKIISHAKKQ